MDRRVLIQLAVYVFAFFLCEYLYLPVEGDETPVRILLSKFTVTLDPTHAVRLDSYVYNFSMKFEQLIFILVVRLFMKKDSIWMLYTFGAAVIEYPLTYNEPIAKILLPDFGGWQPFIPISMATAKFCAVCYFMWGLIKRALE